MQVSRNEPGVSFLPAYFLPSKPESHSVLGLDACTTLSKGLEKVGEEMIQLNPSGHMYAHFIVKATVLGAGDARLVMQLGDETRDVEMDCRLHVCWLQVALQLVEYTPGAEVYIRKVA
jgi:hypothetical protein